MRTHLLDLRLYINAGMPFPACQAHAKLLDCSKSAWTLAKSPANLTCKHCLRIHERNQSRAS